MSGMENPLLLTSLAGVLQMNRECIGIHLDEEYAKKVNDIPEVMFLEIEYKGLQRVVMILQQEISEIRIRQIEDKLRKTEVSKNGIEFDFLSILGVDYLKEIRRQVIKGYATGWHTYMMYLEEEPKIGIKVVLKVSEKDKLIEKEHVRLVRMKDVKREENTMLRVKKERELNVISDMRRVELKPKLESRDWYNKYSKKFLRNLIQVERLTKRVVIAERIMHYKEKEESDDTTEPSDNASEEEMPSIEV